VVCMSTPSQSRHTADPHLSGACQQLGSKGLPNPETAQVTEHEKRPEVPGARTSQTWRFLPPRVGGVHPSELTEVSAHSGCEVAALTVVLPQVPSATMVVLLSCL